VPSFSNSLEDSLHRAIEYANERHHEYATLEHLLLSLVDDRDAASVMRACNVDLERLRTKLTAFLDKELTNLILDQDSEAQPTASF
jgi:ATP-dependent Clp protease ATP-binding subunit ClpA